MAKQRIGLQTFFAPNQPGFTEQLAAVATEQRGRKEVALGEIRKTLSEKQVYSAYAANANKLLENQVKQIAGSLDVDPTAYTEAVNDYLKYYNYSEQFKSFINDAASSYKSDKEVDYNTALTALQKQYVKSGDLDELEQNIINGVDAEKVLLETPGALKPDEIIKSRLEKLGSVDKLVEEASRRLQPEQAGYPFIYQETQSIRQRINNAIEFDDKGNVKIKDAAELERLGILDTMFADNRVDAVVKQRLTSDGKEINDDNKREALRQMMTPFAAGQFERREEVKMIEDPKYKAALKNLKDKIDDKGDDGKPVELLASKLDYMYNGVYNVAAGKESPDWKNYSRTGAKSPANRPYIKRSDIFNGVVATINQDKYAVNGMFLDDKYNVYVRARKVLEGDEAVAPIGKDAEAAKREAVSGTAAEPASKVVYGKEQIFRFDPGYFALTSTTAGLREEYNEFATEALRKYREFRKENNLDDQSGTYQMPPRNQQQEQPQQQRGGYPNF